MIVYEAKWTADTRKAHKAAGGYFAGPNETFPLKDASDVADAWGLAGHADNPAEVRANIKRWAKENGHSDALPDTAKQESAASVVDAGQRPKKKIATLRVCFLEYNARSLNGRIYPKQTCDRIYQAAQRKIANNDLPATVFVSHEAANSNGNTELVGRVARVWQEVNKFYADLDLADTRAAWDMLALAENGALKSESMRVAGVELRHDNGYDLPLVVIPEGVEPDFLGIDLTTRPGLADSARILQTLYESQGKEFHVEDFSIEQVLIEGREEPPAMTLPLYQQIILSGLEEAFPSKSQEAHARVHDHLAGVLDQTVKECHGGSESVRANMLQLDEAGKAIAQKHVDRLIAAHDEAAKACAMECEGCYGLDEPADEPPAMNDNDGDESHQKEKPLTEEEMLAALKAKGFTVEAPKTDAQKLAEQEAKIAALEAKFAQLQETAPTSRQTLAAPSQLEESTLQMDPMYEDGDYLKGDLAPKNWRALGNRRVPWPKDMDPKQALHELAPLLTYRLLEQEASARGMDVATAHKIGANEDI